MIQRPPLKLIYFLTFDEASVKKQYEFCNILNCIVCYTVFFSFWFFLDFSWNFSKKTGRSLWWHFNAKTVIQSSHFKLIISEFSWSFSKKLEEIFSCILMPRLWYNIFFLLCFILFLTFHEESVKNRCTSCTRLQETFYVLSMQSDQIFYSLHGFCSWFFMNP